MLEEAAIQVEVENGIEHVHALKVGQLFEEVAVWMALMDSQAGMLSNQSERVS